MPNDAELFGPLADLMLDEEAGKTPADREQEELQSTVRMAVEEAIQWREENLDEDQAKATDYYMGRPFGDEKKGRSQVIITTVRDAVQSVLPSLNRIFFGSDRVVEFMPFGPEDVPTAEQQTDYVNYVVNQENKGFIVFQSVFKDAMIRKLGVVKSWWEEKITVVGYDYTGLTPEEVAVLLSEEGVEQEELSEEGIGEFSLKITRRSDRGCVKFDVIPSEEFLWSPSARDADDSVMLAHRRDVPGDELVAMGVPQEMVDRHKGQGRNADSISDQLAEARRNDDQSPRDMGEDEQTDATRDVVFSDVYFRYDSDDDGVAELHHIQCVGDQYEIWQDDIVEEHPFSVFPLDPEPHTMVGLSLADYVMDLQRITSVVTRGMLDSLVQAINPTTTVIEGEVNMKDVLNPDVARVIRITRDGAMQTHTTPFVGRDALPVLEWLEDLEERRTGRKNGAMGLDADALQSSTKAAVAASLSAAQQRVEQYARTFAETGMKHLYRRIYRLTVQHKQQPEMVRLRNQFVQVDPRVWVADRDVVVNVALGAGTPEDRLQLLRDMLSAQQEAFANGIPLAGLKEMRNTLARLTEAGGYRDVSEFWRPWGDQEEKQFQEAQANKPPPPPDPAVQLTAQVQMQEIQTKHIEKQAELALKAKEIQLRDDRERDKIARDFAAKLAELGIKQQDVDIKGARQLLDEDAQAVDLLQVISQAFDQATNRQES